jgi:citrate synthase
MSSTLPRSPRVIAGTGSDMYSAITAPSARSGPKHGGANEFAFDTIGRYDNVDDAEKDIVRRWAKRHRIRPPGVHDLRPNLR